MKTSEQVNELAAALSKAQGQFTNLEKNRTVKVRMKTGGEYSFDYATYDEMIAMVRPHLSSNGLALTQGISIVDGLVVVTTLLMHSSGQWLRDELAIVPVDDSPQSVGSASTYGRRYGVSAMLALASETDDDGNAASGHHAETATRRAPPPAAKPAPLAKSAEHAAPTSDAVEKAAADLVTAILACKTSDALDAIQARVAKAESVCNAAQVERIHAALKAARGLVATAPKPPDISSVEAAYEAAETDADMDAADKAAAKLSLTAEHKARMDERRRQAMANVEAGKM